jgi:hypothetical protein
MRILIYCDDPGTGGTSVNASVLGEGLVRRGFAVSVAAHGDWTSRLVDVAACSLDYNP